MPIVLNGSGTVTGISVGGLPDGIVDTDMIAANAVTASKKGSGSIIQVQSSIKKDIASFELSSTYFSNSTQTGIQVSITPSNASNKILLFGMINVDIAGEQFNIGVVFDKNGSLLTDSMGDTAGSRKRVAALGSGADHAQYAPTINVSYLDTAGGTSAITYGLAVNNPSSISRYVYINRSVTDSNDVYGRRAVSTLTAMEIAA
tara:strand:+ start:596 stop:1204 length:609 start_codon:yes stop_codon:yes gene_type:complete